MTRVLQLMALIAALALPALCQNGRLSPDDQREFDSVYSKYQNDSRKNDRDDVDRDVRRMQDIMSRNNIPPDVPFDQIASRGNDRYQGSYQDQDRNGAYPQNAPPEYNRDRDYNRDRGYAQSRLSASDQHEFDKVYDKWEKDSRKHDRDDIRRDERKMQDIMARYNIPSDVPYDQIASPEYRH